MVVSSPKFIFRDFFTSRSDNSLSLWDPPLGSKIISSIIFSFNKSVEVSFIAVAASKVFFGSLHNIEAHPSGEITEYIAFSNIKILLDDAKAIAPPDPPSPIIIEIVGTPKDNEHSIDLAIASAWPLSSAPTPG